MPKTTLKTILLVCSGLLIGLLMPPMEFVAVLLGGYGFSRFRQIFIKDDYVMGYPGLFVVFVLVEIITLFFLAKFNKTLAAVALVIAIISTVYVIHVVEITTPWAPN